MNPPHLHTGPIFGLESKTLTNIGQNIGLDMAKSSLSLVYNQIYSHTTQTVNYLSQYFICLRWESAIIIFLYKISVIIFMSHTPVYNQKIHKLTNICLTNVNLQNSCQSTYSFQYEWHVSSILIWLYFYKSTEFLSIYRIPVNLQHYGPTHIQSFIKCDYF